MYCVSPFVIFICNPLTTKFFPISYWFEWESIWTLFFFLTVKSQSAWYSDHQQPVEISDETKCPPKQPWTHQLAEQSNLMTQSCCFHTDWQVSEFSDRVLSWGSSARRGPGTCQGKTRSCKQHKDIHSLLKTQTYFHVLHTGRLCSWNKIIQRPQEEISWDSLCRCKHNVQLH